MEDKPNIENTNAIINQINNSEHKQKIRQCPHCGQQMPVTSVWKQLWRWPTMNEWIILFMLFMMFVVAWAYNHDTKICKEYVSNIDLICLQRGHNETNSYRYNMPNLTGVQIINSSASNETR